MAIRGIPFHHTRKIFIQSPIPFVPMIYLSWRNVMNEHTYRDIVFHIVFSTKNREDVITPTLMKGLRAVLADKAGNLGLIVHIANGRGDHVHLQVSAPPKWSVSEIVKNLKGYSSYKIPGLYWQRGYGVFTVDRSSFDKVFNYIKHQ
ncbi:MAG TPA: IS200/IS605 family transposase [Spirochaetota bacterium]|nr:IS200/IS605 family transposase [Spirochaetota bacterium]